MYIKKEVGNGRGEFEIAGEHDGLKANDLVDLDLYLDCGLPYGVRPLDMVLRHSQGKLRLRIKDKAAGKIHLHRQVLALLMLPQSVRDETVLHGGQPTVMYLRYVVSRIELRAVHVDADRATLTLHSIEVSNGSHVDEIGFADRMAKVVRIHNGAADFPIPISGWVEAHRGLLTNPEPLRANAEDVVGELMNAVAEDAPDYGLEYQRTTDVLPTLEKMLAPQPEPEPVPIAQIPDDELELRRRVVGEWRRWATARGPTAVAFRRRVHAAYHQRCVVCGLRFPRSKHCLTPGVDAAHILPWADYDLDLVSNGLCLCKLHHWAFDNRLITIRMSEETGAFQVMVTETAVAALANEPESLAELQRFEGPIPDNRLPFNPAERPRPSFLELLYEKVRPDLTS